MIYKDLDSIYDREEVPAFREGNCINCGFDWDNHNGWSCHNSHSKRRGFMLEDEDKRFLTKVMQDSISPEAPIVYAFEFPVKNIPSNTSQSKVAESCDPSTHWKGWAHNVVGDCPCGIKRTQCEFHK